MSDDELVFRLPHRELRVGDVLTEQDIIVLKSTCHYRAHFDPIAETTFAAIAPGGHGANPADFPYTKLRPGIRYYPLGPAREG